VAQELELVPVELELAPALAQAERELEQAPAERALERALVELALAPAEPEPELGRVRVELELDQAQAAALGQDPGRVLEAPAAAVVLTPRLELELAVEPARERELVERLALERLARRLEPRPAAVY